MTKKWLLLSLKALLSVALITWVFHAKEIDVGAALSRIGDMAPSLILPALGVFVLQILLCSLRWRGVLRAVGGSLDLVPGFRLMYIGAFFHQTLPALVGGDVVRTYLAYRLGVPLRSAVNGILLERVVTLVALILLVAAIQPAFLPRVGEEAGAWMMPAIAAALAAVAAGVTVLTLLDRLPHSARRWSFVRGLADLAADTRILFLSPRNLPRALGWAMAAHASLAVGLYLLARGLGLGIGLVDCLALFLPVLLLTALPVTVAGWGLREGGMVYALGLIGVPAESALALSILYGLFTLGIALPGGLVWLATGLSRAEVKSALTEMSEPVAESAER